MLKQTANQINYSLGVLIVLLMFFWFTCKCIGTNQYKHLHVNNCKSYGNHNLRHDNRNLRHDNRNLQHKESFSPTFSYGNDTDIEFSNSPIPYIRYDYSNNKLKIPNSMSAYSHLFDKELIKCGIDTANDKDSSSMHMQKKKIESIYNRPKSITSTRNKQDSDRIDRIAMASF
jgi:hypothetical protein